jgi:hypothetical protein
VLVLATPDDASAAETSIAWRITASPGGSRIVLRWRSESGGAVADVINHIMASAAWVMERKELLTIADRATRAEQ